MSKALQEIKNLNRSKTVSIYKKHWKNENPLIVENNKLTAQQVQKIIEKGSSGCWFTPKNKWVSLTWLELHNYKNIADRIRVLKSLYGDRKRYFITETNRKTFMLGHVDTRYLMESI